LDRENIFSIPVVEAYSDLEESYLAQISHPMDFRTIEEERLKVYKSITELQEDLVLVFRNCMEYNKPGSELFETAR
jgi:Bromodomain